MIMLVLGGCAGMEVKREEGRKKENVGMEVRKEEGEKKEKEKIEIVEVGYWDTPGDAKGVFVSGNYAYVANGSAGLRVIDISDPSSPFEVGYCNTPRCALGVFVSGNYAYVAASVDWNNNGYDEGRLYIIDVSNPSSPSEIGYYDTPGAAMGVYVFGNYAYVADGYSGLVILRIK